MNTLEMVFQEGKLEGKIEGEAIGEEKGRLLTLKFSIRQFLLNGVPAENVVLWLKVPMELVLEVAREMKNGEA